MWIRHGVKQTMILFAIISVLTAHVHSIPVAEGKNGRSGKFMRFGTPDDLFSDVLDEMQDPLSAAAEMGMANVSDRLKDSAHHDPTGYQTNTKTTTERNPIKTDEKIALYNQNTGKFELITSTSGHFMLPVKPVTENGVIFYGGQHYQYRKPGSEESNNGNRTGEIKIFWSSVTDAIENLPFLPVQVNVPDMISAMANFLSTSIPIINRFTNPNHPRLPATRPEANEVISDNYHKFKYGSNGLYGETVEDRELKNGVRLSERKSNKRRKGQKRKNGSGKVKSEKGSSKGLIQRPFVRRTTEMPANDAKIMHVFGGSESASTILKNMPLSRKKFQVRDREVFNFKNSDIKNSPIMILNLPERPMTYHRTNIEQRVGGEPEAVSSETLPAPRVASTPKPKNLNRVNSRKPAATTKRVRSTPKPKRSSAEKSKSN